MEGYFPIHIYSQLTGVSNDTAYHRAERKTVPSFKDEHGTWFVYYCDWDINETPEGYLWAKDYALKFGVTYGVVLAWIKKGVINENDVLRTITRMNGSRQRRTFIRDSAVPIFKCTIKTNNPEGYLTACEWAANCNMPKCVVYSYIRQGRIDGLKLNGRWYIKEDFKLNYKRRGTK